MMAILSRIQGSLCAGCPFIPKNVTSPPSHASLIRESFDSYSQERFHDFILLIARSHNIHQVNHWIWYNGYTSRHTSHFPLLRKTREECSKRLPTRNTPHILEFQRCDCLYARSSSCTGTNKRRFNLTALEICSGSYNTTWILTLSSVSPRYVCRVVSTLVDV